MCAPFLGETAGLFYLLLWANVNAVTTWARSCNGHKTKVLVPWHGTMLALTSCEAARELARTISLS